MKTAIVLTPDSEKELEQKLKSFSPSLDSLDYEVIAIMNTISVEDYQWISNVPNLTCIEVTSLKKINKQCIVRYLVSKDTKGILFLDMNEDISKEVLEKRIKFLEAEQLIGIVGNKADKPDAFVFKTLFHKLLNLLNINKKEFNKRCLDENGDVKHVKPENLLTTIEMWDRIGGFSVTSENAYLEYCLRVQALGYTILPLTE